ncbi:MAG TPA: isoprenylcysteine carboxylmethyltransferase family protein [Candidatus Limnocylindria bacterium]|nr:isoprenylcysteine carboxylmethyltransferase family protein [Candidatus Limnocylindria bacterium]
MSVSSSRLPSLGPRGEGWVLGQLLLLALVGLLGVRRHDRGLRASGARRPLAVIGAALLFGGALLAGRAVHQLGPSVTPMPRPRPEARLVRTGVYAEIRHPIYAALILLALGWATATASLASGIVAAVLAIWLDAKARREEAWLADRFPDYAGYRATTSRFLPGVYLATAGG